MIAIAIAVIGMAGLPVLGCADECKLVNAIAKVESGYSDEAVGDEGRAHGRYQLTRRYIKDVNTFYGAGYTLKDAHDVTKATEIVHLYLSYWGRKYTAKTGMLPTCEVLARIHNGGPRGWEKKATVKYWHKVKKAMEESK